MHVIATVHALPSSSCHIKGRKFVGRDWRNNSIAEQRVLEEPNHVVVCSVTVLARLFGPGRHRQVDRRPGNIATSAHTVIIEAVAALTQ